MPRKLRVEYPGAMYHVMSRGDRREDIFLDNVARKLKIKTRAIMSLRKRLLRRLTGFFRTRTSARIQFQPKKM